MNLILIFAIAFLIVFREGYQQADNVRHSKRLSAIWHGLGFLMRLFVFALIYLSGANVYLLIAAGLLMWPVYNIACNISRGQHWFYLSNHGIDKLIKKVLFFVKFPKAKQFTFSTEKMKLIEKIIDLIYRFCCWLDNVKPYPPKQFTFSTT